MSGKKHVDVTKEQALVFLENRYMFIEYEYLNIENRFVFIEYEYLDIENR